ncbi:hypothetical protein Syun_023712 [Stephania yunnanensis]|uniref:Uncharacterized protein n=1 Tax=Stephania yunnanensis TaxID=152371 RepID=A0AAP0I3H1_9MAGN
MRKWRRWSDAVMHQDGEDKGVQDESKFIIPAHLSVTEVASLTAIVASLPESSAPAVTESYCPLAGAPSRHWPSLLGWSSAPATHSSRTIACFASSPKALLLAAVSVAYPRGLDRELSLGMNEIGGYSAGRPHQQLIRVAPSPASRPRRRHCSSPPSLSPILAVLTVSSPWG